MKNQHVRKYLIPLCLILLFFILITAIIPDGAVFGSHTDWLSQHVTLAETIRNSCIEQHTLLPSWIGLGGGSNGYQFAYYGFLRPDILIGCLLPQVPMLYILIGYILAAYLSSVLLCFVWIRSEGLPPVLAFAGSVLFMTAGCLFHMHRQIMFVNYLPFLLLAFLCIRKKRFRLLPLCFCLICLSSFYFSFSAFAAAGWYWYQQEGALFWRSSFWKKFIPSAVAAAGMAAALLLPTALVLLEHGRGGDRFSLLKLAELIAPHPVMNNLLFNEYGMGLTFLCLYPILAGLSRRETRRDSLFFLLAGIFGIFSWLLNGTLYARPKILIPFMPLVILHCVRFLRDTAVSPQPSLNEAGSKPLPLYPFAVIFPVGLLWFSQKQFPWIMAEAFTLFCIVLGQRIWIRNPGLSARFLKSKFRRISAAFCLLLLILTAPVGMFLTTAGTEDWVKKTEISAGFTSEELQAVNMDPLYHFDSLISPLVSGNELPKADVTRSTMYSSITNLLYSRLYYDTLLTPVRINNRVALLTSDNPFLLNLLGVRYLETKADDVPAGYQVIFQSGDNVIAENKDVLPSAYFTDDLVSQDWFESLDPLEKLDVITRKTVVDATPGEPSGSGKLSEAEERSNSGRSMQSFLPELIMKQAGGSLPDRLEITATDSGYEITAEKECSLELHINNPQPDSILLLSFQVNRLTHSAVVIDINGIRNKLSGLFAPYPNGNDRFEYQFSTDAKKGMTELSVTFSKGHYSISDIQWHLYPREQLSTKKYTPLTPDQSENGTSRNILAGTINTDRSGCFATSIPIQRGLEILVDGKPSEIITVNESFAGTALTPGTHRIEISFSPPGKTAGIVISLLASCGYFLFLLTGGIHRRKMRRQGQAVKCTQKYVIRKRESEMKIKKELFTYLISGGITTGVNYLLYGSLLFVHIPWLWANSIAWAGAVLAAYMLNRKWVFHSDHRILPELISFTGVRFLTLLTENALLWLLIDLAGAAPLPAKLAVSVVTAAGNYVLCKYGIFSHRTELSPLSKRR